MWPRLDRDPFVQSWKDRGLAPPVDGARIIMMCRPARLRIIGTAVTHTLRISARSHAFPPPPTEMSPSRVDKGGGTQVGTIPSSSELMVGIRGGGQGRATDRVAVLVLVLVFGVWWWCSLDGWGTTVP